VGQIEMLMNALDVQLNYERYTLRGAPNINKGAKEMGDAYNTIL